MLPSLWEGISSLLEAWRGLPVVASDTGGNPKWSSTASRDCCFLSATCPSSPTGSRLLYGQPDLRERLGAQGAQRIRQEFALDAMVGDRADVQQ